MNETEKQTIKTFFRDLNKCNSNKEIKTYLNDVFCE